MRLDGRGESSKEPTQMLTFLNGILGKVIGHTGSSDVAGEREVIN